MVADPALSRILRIEPRIGSAYRAKRVEPAVRSRAGTRRAFRRAFRFSQPVIIQRRSWAFEPLHHKEWLEKTGDGRRRRG